MNRRPPPVEGVMAPHIPAALYRDADGRIVVVQALPPERAGWAPRLAALGIVLAAGVGTTGLLLLILAALDVAARIAAGIATPAGVTLTLGVAYRRATNRKD